jgi:gliding motility-associated-like protein
MPYIYKKLYYLIFGLFFLPPSVSWAKHIVGGEITYKLISRDGSTNRYEFTMRIYRDCDATGNPPPAQLDSRAMIGVYAKQSGMLVDNYPVDISGPSRKIAPPNLPCLIPPDVCVEEGTYFWIKDMPIISDDYVILYSRCCRNEAIDNIIRPGSVGATYSVEITNFAQTAGNSSPTFKQFPPTVICGGYALNFDHSAIDDDGDQLVYKFCEPYTGGGQSNGRGCDAVIPNPPCWPIVGNITYREPEYSYLRPMGGDPVIQINPNTGMITGTPVAQGLFVVSVCVEEYRNGKLLSILKRDFQFDVQTCTPTVEGRIKADTVVGNTYFLFNCGDRTVNVTNTSLDRRYISDFRFDVGINGSTSSFKEWEPKIPFPDTGVYKGNLFLNPGTQCADTINLVFNVYNSVLTDFSYQYDTCIASSVSFTDKSISSNGPIVLYKWEFGDGKQAATQNTSYLYPVPGEKNVRLSIKDSKGCAETVVKTFNWQPVPPLLIIQPSTFNGCTPGSVTFTNLSTPIDSTYIIRWTFGDGSTSNAISPVHSYKLPGTYSISLEVTSPIGCKTSRGFREWIKINQGTTADFEYSPEKITTFNNTVNFTDKSAFATRWQWFFDGKGFSSRQNPTFTFKDSGYYNVKLLVANQFGCIDSITKRLDVEPRVTYWLPNAFSPNDDGVNDLYEGTGIMAGIKDFDMKIWNRWGELIFQTSDPNKGWNGQKNNTGSPSPQGVYLCVVTYSSPRDERAEIRSYATLIR